MDNIETIDYEFDTSFLIGHEAQERGYDIFYYNPKDLFIKGFDKQLIGVKVGDEKIVEATLPENFPEKELVNKAAKFKCKILNVKNDEALLGAIDLGIAMQLTNIARDVVEDKKRNREYINHDFSSIKQTILEAENFYNISFKAIKSIPIKSRFSVIVARRIYRKIGHHIIKRESIENYNKSGKIFVPTYGKIIESFLSIIDFFTLLFMSSWHNSFVKKILQWSC